ncbi:hypothetical protein [Methylocystis sp.]|jgi:hypothetical protein|uniref:hypothetical protein n=1 Tax=Methylocystis sp. TaxID=1911079 RepID=UPI003DA53C51
MSARRIPTDAAMSAGRFWPAICLENDSFRSLALRSYDGSKAAKPLCPTPPHRSCGIVGRRLLLFGTYAGFSEKRQIIIGANHGYAELQDRALRVLALLFGAQFLHDIQWPEPVGAHVLA